MPRIVNPFDEVDRTSEFKTYYIRLENEDGVFFKIGRCKGRFSKRFNKESSDLEIEVKSLWGHKTEEQAERHERRLFRENPGDMPYVGRCGPLEFGGNLEVYSHDVMAGEPAPKSYLVRVLTMASSPRYAIGYCDVNPRALYADLVGVVAYMDYALGPPEVHEGRYIQVPHMSARESVTIATEAFLDDALSEWAGERKKSALEAYRYALEAGCTVHDWSDYRLMKFRGMPFRKPASEDYS